MSEGYRNFDLKSLTEEERQLIENIEFLDKTPRGQRRKLQLYEDKWQRNR